MPEYAILILPSANRVYTDTSPRLLRAELAAFGDRVLTTTVTGTDTRTIGGVDYVILGTGEPLSEEDVAYLSNLSSAYALFEVRGELLRPLTLDPVALFDSDLLTIQKYTGKTNELFTRLLVNLTMLATDRPADLLRGARPGDGHRPPHVLDPLAGRGTTLNQAMMYGFDATGVETDGKDFEAYERFLKTWLRTKRIKHSAESGALRRNKARLGQRLDVTYGATKEAYRAGDTRRVTYYNTDTLRTDELLRPGSVDAIVTDAPYGVRHGSKARDESLSRSPRELLAAALPVWTRVLRRGGALGVSYNTYVLDRDELTTLLTDAGLTVVTDPAHTTLAHRVDQSILRDVLIARNPAS
ncbi:TRM11 family SAM-dependent methyltransferase [Saccharomonospora iraqiensis]|uniref:TRM11 family SAM-dependent methyltransferase n=1 Tax=Saccharomonospora iraqiensis TaxID=52698 RepID=UPI00022E1CA2|nr:hypothetical protein [Saccharomonospora iraqiensis]